MSRQTMIQRQQAAKKSVTALDVASKTVYWGLWIVLVFYALSMLVLPLYMLITAMKEDNLECVFNPFGLPQKIVWSNFTEIFKIFDEKLNVSIGSMFFVSIVTSVVRPLLSTFFTTCWAYLEAKYNFFGKKFFFSLGIVLMILPIIGSLPAAMQVNKALGVYDNLFMSIITGCGGGFYGTNFLLMYGAFKAIPWDYAEAAQIDGAGRYRIFFDFYLRMALPQAVVLMVLGFMGTWNDYSTYMVWLPSTPNISYGMYLFNQCANSYRVSLPQLMAGFTMVMIPTIIIYDKQCWHQYYSLCFRPAGGYAVPVYKRSEYRGEAEQAVPDLYLRHL